MIDDKTLIAKADAGEGLTVEEIKRYQQLVKPQHHVYGNLPEYLHGIDRQAEQLDEDMRGKLLNNARYKRTGNFMEDYRRQTEVNRLIEQEILSELVYAD